MEPEIDRIARDRLGIATLFPYQRLVITNVLEGVAGDADRARQVVILPTGAGKSLCFTLPALLLRRVTLIVFPLISLLNDQVRRLRQNRVPAVLLCGGQSGAERRRQLALVERGGPLCVVTNPETLQSSAVRRALRNGGVDHAVIDEAHCISEWGDTFRPAYLTLGESLAAVQPRAITAFTATASPRIVERIAEVVYGGRHVHTVRANPDRPNISYRALPVLHPGHALAAMARSCTTDGWDCVDPPVWSAGDQLRLPAIVFCRSRNATSYYAGILAAAARQLDPSQRFEVLYYHAGLPPAAKRQIEERFFDAHRAILCSTCAYGLGVDKANVRTVVHTYIPATIEAFLQESGRGGRDRSHAQSVTLVAPGDRLGATAPGTIDGPSADERDGGRRAEITVRDAMVGTACRRRSLVAGLDWSLDTCTGCDVCIGDARSHSEAEQALLGALARLPARVTTDEWVGLLVGRPSLQAALSGAAATPACGILRGWQRWEAEEVIEGLIRRGLVLERAGRLSPHRRQLRYKTGRRPPFRRSQTDPG